MKVQIMINNEELLLLSYVDRVVWGTEQVAAFALIVEESGLSLRTIGEKAGVTHSYVDRLRKHVGAVDIETLKKILNALDKTIYSVFKPPTVEFYIDTPVTH